MLTEKPFIQILYNKKYILDNLFIMRYLTTYIYNDILAICHIKRRKRLQSLIVPDAGTNGILVTLKKNQRFVQVATAHTGRNRGKETRTRPKNSDN